MEREWIALTINFHSTDNRLAYADRIADPTWRNKMEEICDVKGLNVLDLGCGGGIYARALIDLGAAHVTGLDFSREQLFAAKANSKAYSRIVFHAGNALDTGLETKQYDIVFARAVIHHIQDLLACFKEIHRLLKPGGQCLIQDRTPKDCFLEGSPAHIRGYFFSKFPRLKAIEVSRRYNREMIDDVMKKAGFPEVREHKLWETRKTHQTKDDLIKDIRQRIGRSILHELSDQELDSLAVYIKDRLKECGSNPIVEKDRWSIWQARKI